MPLRLAELAFEAVMEMAMIRQLLELFVNRAVVELVSSKLHVVVSSLHSNHVLETLQELFVFERLGNVVVRTTASLVRPAVSRPRSHVTSSPTSTCTG